MCRQLRIARFIAGPQHRHGAAQIAGESALAVILIGDGISAANVEFVQEV